MDTIQVAKISLVFFLTSSFLKCHSSPWRTYQPVYLPGPQFCPDTGRTVCTAVDYYPTEQIFTLLTYLRSQRFNLSSLFVDERKGDIEPNLAQLPTSKPYYQNGHGNDQHPPGGRFSPAGYNNWKVPMSEKPPDYSGRQHDRWKQVSQSPGFGGTVKPNAIPRNLHENTPVHVSDQRTLNLRRNPIAQQRFNYNDRSRSSFSEVDKENLKNNGVTQYNRVDPQMKNIPFEHFQQFDNRNLSGHHSQDGTPISQEPYQIQPPFTQHRIKGQNLMSGITMKPYTINNWKGAPSYGDNINSDVNEQTTRFNGRRDKRNEDVEEVCEVRSTYVPPRAALNDNSEWKYIVNVPERDQRFTQVIRVDICTSPGQPCSSRISLPFGFESRCRQKYIKKKLLSLNPDGQGTSEDNFFIPSCCVCEITRPNKKR